MTSAAERTSTNWPDFRLRPRGISRTTFRRHRVWLWAEGRTGLKSWSRAESPGPLWRTTWTCLARRPGPWTGRPGLAPGWGPRPWRSPSCRSASGFAAGTSDRHPPRSCSGTELDSAAAGRRPRTAWGEGPSRSSPGRGRWATWLLGGFLSAATVETSSRSQSAEHRNEGPRKLD